MKILKPKIIFVIAVLLLTFSLVPGAVQADCADVNACSNSTLPSTNNCPSSGSADAGNKQSANPKEIQACLKLNPIFKRLNEIINILAGAVGIVVTGAIIVGGIQYIMAGGNATAITAARQRITNALIALAAFIFMYSFLQWLIPGGVFG